MSDETTGTGQGGEAGRSRPSRLRRALAWLAWGVGSILMLLALGAAILTIQIRANAVTRDQHRLPADLHLLTKQPESLAIAAPKSAAPVLPTPIPTPSAQSDPSIQSIISGYTAQSAISGWNGGASLKTLDQYLQCQITRGHQVKGARLYLELTKAYLPASREWTSLTDSWNLGAPLSVARRRWLADHAALLDLYRRMLAAGGPPLPTSDDWEKTPPSQQEYFPLPYYFLVLYGGEWLVAESQCRREDGDLAGAADALADAAALASLRDSDLFKLGHLVNCEIRFLGARAINRWLEASPPPEPVLRRLLAIVDGMATCEDRLVAAYARCLATGRPILLNTLDGPPVKAIRLSLARLDEGFNGTSRFMTIYNAESRPMDAARDLISSARQYRTVKILRSTVLGLRIKANARELVDLFDALARQRLEALQWSYAELKGPRLDNALKALMEKSRIEQDALAWFSQEEFFTGDGDIEYFRRETSAAAAEVNLSRAGLRLLLGEAPGPATDTHSPWRDPFTERPLKIIRQGGQILIYSLGPDLKDQGGVGRYPPEAQNRQYLGVSNFPGDMALRLTLPAAPAAP